MEPVVVLVSNKDTDKLQKVVPFSYSMLQFSHELAIQIKQLLSLAKMFHSSGMFMLMVM